MTSPEFWAVVRRSILRNTLDFFYSEMPLEGKKKSELV